MYTYRNLLTYYIRWRRRRSNNIILRWVVIQRPTDTYNYIYDHLYIHSGMRLCVVLRGFLRAGLTTTTHYRRPLTARFLEEFTIKSPKLSRDLLCTYTHNIITLYTLTHIQILRRSYRDLVSLGRHMWPGGDSLPPFMVRKHLVEIITWWAVDVCTWWA